MTFVEFMRSRIGTNWAVVRRPTKKLYQRYDVLLLPREYTALKIEYERTASVRDEV